MEELSITVFFSSLKVTTLTMLASSRFVSSSRLVSDHRYLCGWFSLLPFVRVVDTENRIFGLGFEFEIDASFEILGVSLFSLEQEDKM